jgi:hypothetical protein
MRLIRAASIALTVVLLAFAGALFVAVYNGALARGEVGYDAWLYLDEIAGRWLATGNMYYPIQFAGPYPDSGIVNLYPPVAMYLFAPMSLVPRLLWWAIPLTVIAWHLWTCRPAWWTWPLFALVACTVKVSATLVYGNSEMWTVAAVAMAVRYPAASWLLALKPPLLPFTIMGATDRRWWYGLAAVVVVSLPLGTSWLDWIAAMQNLDASLLRSASALPLLAVPAVAWLARRVGPGYSVMTLPFAASQRTRAQPE